MANYYFTGQTVDDVMREAFEALFAEGDQINPSRGSAIELTGVVIDLSNPRGRLSRTETRGKPFSCLGELFWYLSGDCDLEFISYYIQHYKAATKGNSVSSGYGSRLFSNRGHNQIANITNLLRKNPSTRRAVIQLFEAGDVIEEGDIPCTCTLQFLIRRDALHMVTHMRSNDAYIGLPHDIFCFTMIQEILARSLNVDVGMYKHMVGSFHLYDKDKDFARRFIDEGWQSTKNTMPQMPTGDPWPAIEELKRIEVAIRTNTPIKLDAYDHLDIYWRDLVYLLLIYRFSKVKDIGAINEVSRKVSFDVYRFFIDYKVRQLSRD